MSEESTNHNGILANLYFDLEKKTSDGKAQCRKCDAFCKDNSGHGNLASHVKNKHSCWKEELNRALEDPNSRSSGGMDKFVTFTKVVSNEAKNMASWIEWIVLSDLPITVVENKLFRKNSNLNLTSYKTCRR